MNDIIHSNDVRDFFFKTETMKRNYIIAKVQPTIIESLNKSIKYIYL